MISKLFSVSIERVCFSTFFLFALFLSVTVTNSVFASDDFKDCDFTSHESKEIKRLNLQGVIGKRKEDVAVVKLAFDALKPSKDGVSVTDVPSVKAVTEAKSAFEKTLASVVIDAAKIKKISGLSFRKKSSVRAKQPLEKFIEQSMQKIFSGEELIDTDFPLQVLMLKTSSFTPRAPKHSRTSARGYRARSFSPKRGRSRTPKRGVSIGQLKRSPTSLNSKKPLRVSPKTQKSLTPTSPKGLSVATSIFGNKSPKKKKLTCWNAFIVSLITADLETLKQSEIEAQTKLESEQKAAQTKLELERGYLAAAQTKLTEFESAVLNHGAIQKAAGKDQKGKDDKQKKIQKDQEETAKKVEQDKLALSKGKTKLILTKFEAQRKLTEAQTKQTGAQTRQTNAERQKLNATGGVVGKVVAWVGGTAVMAMGAFYAIKFAARWANKNLGKPSILNRISKSEWRDLRDLVVAGELRSRLDGVVEEIVCSREMFNILLYGMPGTGKTLFGNGLTKKMSEACDDIEFYITSGSRFAQMSAPEATQAFHDLLDYVHKLALKGKRVVIFVDEAERIFMSRYGKEATPLTRALTEAFLASVIAPSNDNFMFILATNHVEKLDGAVYDRTAGHQFEIGLPALIERGKLFLMYLTKAAEKRGVVIPEKFKSRIPKFARESNRISARGIEELANMMIRKSVRSKEKFISFNDACKMIRLQVAADEKQRRRVK